MRVPESQLLSVYKQQENNYNVDIYNTLCIVFFFLWNKTSSFEAWTVMFIKSVKKKKVNK